MTYKMKLTKAIRIIIIGRGRKQIINRRIYAELNIQ